MHAYLVSMAMKIKKGGRPSWWKEFILKFKPRIIFNDDVIAELERGLELGRLLKLPFNLACNYQHIGKLMTPEILMSFSCLA